jgi:hypothetical protein
VFFQELDAAGNSDPALTISLREQRIDHGGSPTFGPTIDFPAHRDPLANPRHGTVSMTRRTIIVVAKRGPWLVAAAIGAPNAETLPLDAALHWVAIAPLPR